MKSALFIVLILVPLLPTEVSARTTATFGESEVGKSCGRLEHSTDFDTLVQCTTTATSGGLKQTAPIIIGTVTAPPYTATTCDANKAGMIQYASSVMQFCNGTSWLTLSPKVSFLGTSASATSPRRSDDATVGLFSAAADTVSIATAGTERVTVNSAGRVGIGNTAPSAPLHIGTSTSGGSMVIGASDATNEGAEIGLEGAGSYDTWYFDVYQNVLRARTSSSNSNMFQIFNSATGQAGLYVEGDVGIGTTTPPEKLSVVGAIYAGDADSTSGSLILGGKYGSGYTTTLGSLYSSGGSVLGYAVRPRSGAAGYTSTTAANLARSAITLDADFEIATAAAQTTAVGSAVTLTSRVLVTNAGSVGIGKTAPAAKLDVSGAVKVANDATACSSTNAGAIRWTGSAFQGCNGTSWTALDSSGVLVGEIKEWPTEIVPSGYLECNGATISRTTYAALFAVIGTRYGAGDGSTTFKIPDYRGEFLRGWAHGTTNDPDRATRTARGDGTTGDYIGTEQASQYASHLHAANPPAATAASAGAHTHTLTQGSETAFMGVKGAATVENTSTVTTSSAGAHTHTVDIASFNTGNAGGNESRPRNINIMYIIKY